MFDNPLSLQQYFIPKSYFPHIHNLNAFTIGKHEVKELDAIGKHEEEEEDPTQMSKDHRHTEVMIKPEVFL